MLFTLNDPAYLKTGLEPAISAKTLDFHFNGHHKAYLNKTNDLVKGTSLENKSLEDVILVAKTTNNAALFNNATQLWNHSFFWDCMAPTNQTGQISPELEKLIKESFGSVADFKKKFTDSAIANFGSGWTWLVNINGKLEIQNTSNAESPVTLRVTPLLTVDVWEHAYYLDHQNRRPEYLNKWWEVVNWKFVDQQLKQ
uniref:Superoxide dismutase n=1 Tax=Acanthamoeba castellanii TaxID=5755 RepID=Q5IZD9_ACACA|nr:iron-superoxide dismutase [Acanthamoeba castellanii]